MGKQRDPLRTQARTSRVEKSRRTQRDGRTRPSWYYRVLAITFQENREVETYDFDEDLSEIEEDKEQERDHPEQLKDEEEGNDDMEEEEESGSPYDGSDAEYYYELKEEREERKKEKLRECEEKEREREIERTKEEEVLAAYRSLNKAQKERKVIPVGLLAGQSFKLFCSDHVDHFYSDCYATKRVDFYYLDDAENPGLDKQKPTGEANMLYGDVYLNGNANCSFGPFLPPKRASQKAFKVKSCNGEYDLSFKFISNGYLALRVSREMVFMNPYSARPPAPPPAAPEVFKFVGIWRDLEKEKAERRIRMAKARRSPSPRES